MEWLEYHAGLPAVVEGTSPPGSDPRSPLELLVQEAAHNDDAEAVVFAAVRGYSAWQKRISTFKWTPAHIGAAHGCVSFLRMLREVSGCAVSGKKAIKDNNGRVPSDYLPSADHMLDEIERPIDNEDDPLAKLKRDLLAGQRAVPDATQKKRGPRRGDAGTSSSKVDDLAAQLAEVDILRKAVKGGGGHPTGGSAPPAAKTGPTVDDSSDDSDDDGIKVVQTFMTSSKKKRKR